MAEDDIDIGINVHAQGVQIAQQIRSNINALRVQIQQLIALQAGTLRANAQQVGSLQQLVAAQRQAIQAMNQMTAAQRNAQQAITTTGLTLRGLISSVASAAAAFAGFEGFRAFTEAGLRFNATIESATLGIATLITAQAQLHTKNGELLTGTKALGAAQDLAADQVQKLRIANLQTTATLDELIAGFQQAVGVGLRWGFTLDQSRKFTVLMAQAAANLQLPMNQLNEEIRSLLQGTINPRNTRIATALHITNEQVKNAQNAGQLFDFISKRMEAFSIAGEATAKTFAGVMSNIKDSLLLITGEATRPLFDKLKEVGQTTLEEIFDMKNARISEKFSGIIEVAQRIFGNIGDLLGEAINGAVKGAEAFNQWMAENGNLVEDLWQTMGLIVDQFKGLIRDVGQVVFGIGQAGVEAGVLNLTFRVIAVAIAGLRDGLKFVVSILGLIGGIVLEAILDPFRLLLKAIAAVVQFTNKDMADSLNHTADSIDGFLTDVSHGIKDIWKDFAAGDTATAKLLAQFEAMGNAADKTTEQVKKTKVELATVTTTADTNKKQDPAKLAAGITAAAKAELSRQQRDLKIALDNNKISYAEYYSSLTKAQQHSIDEQIRAQNILLNAAKTDDAKEKIRSDIKQLTEERLQVIQDNAEKLRVALEKLDDEIRKAQIQLLKDQGKNAEARALEVEGEFKKMQARLIKNSKDSGAEIIKNLFEIDNAKAQMQDFERQVKIITDTLKTEQDDIQIQLEAHTITQQKGQEQLADAYQKAHDRLAAILPIMKRVAEITQDPASLQAVRDLEIQMAQWGLAIKQARDDLLKLKEGALDAFQTGIANLLDQAAQGFQDWGERVKDVGRQIIAALRQVAAQMLATLIIQNSLKFFGFSSGGLVGGSTAGSRAISGDAGAGPGVPVATGGYITGPGTGTSDSIPAWLSHGEYVINAKAAKSVGIDLLDGINSLGHSPGVRSRKRARGYAEGGMVTPTSNDVNQDSRLTVGLEDGLVLRHLETTEGTKFMLKFVERNSNKMRQALGIG